MRAMQYALGIRLIVPILVILLVNVIRNLSFVVLSRLFVELY